MLAAVLFGGHLALHHWDLRQTRRELLLRACRAPEYVARAWVEGEEGQASAKLWLQFAGGKPRMVGEGRIGCVEAAIRLRGAGIVLDAGAPQADATPGRNVDRPPAQHSRTRQLSSLSPLT